MNLEDKVKVNSKHITTLLEHVTDLLSRVQKLEAKEVEAMVEKEIDKLSI